MSLDVKKYHDILTKENVNILREELNDLIAKLKCTNEYTEFSSTTLQFLPADATPKNAIEKYILSVYKFVAEDAGIKVEDVVGIEWWYHKSTKVEVVNIHMDCDEYEAEYNNNMISPVRGTVTYLGDCDQAPTCLFDIEQRGSDPTDISDNSSGSAYSYAKAGSLLSFDGKLLHGVIPPQKEMERFALMFNIWDRKLEERTWRNHRHWIREDFNTEGKEINFNTDSAKSVELAEVKDNLMVTIMEYPFKNWRAMAQILFPASMPKEDFVMTKHNTIVKKEYTQ